MCCVHLPSWNISTFQCRRGKLHVRNKAMILFAPGEELRAKTRSKGKDCKCFHASLSYVLESYRKASLLLHPRQCNPQSSPASRGSPSVFSFLWSSKIYLLHITMTSHYSWPQYTEASCTGGGHGGKFRGIQTNFTLWSQTCLFLFFPQITWPFFCFLHHGTLSWPVSIFLWCRVPWCRHLEQVKFAQEIFHAYSAQVIKPNLIKILELLQAQANGARWSWKTEAEAVEGTLTCSI